MADLFVKQAKEYSETRPSYPPELFEFIASKTPGYDLAWDVGTGSGQAATSLAGFYKNVIATDTSQEQLEYAPKLPNVIYRHTPSTMSLNELDQHVAAPATVDLVAIAQALHWFDLPNFYQQVNRVLKRPHGIIAAWCYTVPEVNDSVDSVFNRFYTHDSKPYWDRARKHVDQKYGSIYFPYEPVIGTDHTGPFDFKTERVMDLDGYFEYLRSWSAYQTARKNGVELLTNQVVEDFQNAWREDGNEHKVVKFPIHLRIGRVGNQN